MPYQLLLLAAWKGHAEIVRVLATFGACVKMAMNNGGCTPVFVAAREGHAETVRVLAELGADVNMPTKDGRTPVFIAAQRGHSKVIRLLALLGADIMATSTEVIGGRTPLGISAANVCFEATKTLVLLGAPITIADLRQYSNAPGDARRLRDDLQSWATGVLVQHRIFTSTFLFGCSAHDDIVLSILEGEPGLRELIAAFVGVVMGAELRHTRAVEPVIEAVDWAAHDQARQLGHG